MQQARALQIVHVGTVTQSHALTGDPSQGASHATVLVEHRLGFAPARGRQQLDGIEDLDVTRAATEVAGEGFGDLVARGRGVLIEQMVGLECEPRNAETTLEARCGHKAVGNQPALVLAQALQGQNGLSSHLLRRHRAADLGQTIDQRQTTPALPLRLTPILGRIDPTPRPQRLEQALPRSDLHRPRLPIERELQCLHVL